MKREDDKIMKPVLYLDIDGVLWNVNSEGAFVGANGLEDFLSFVLDKFELRWCTAWACRGYVATDSLERLAAHTGVPVKTWKLVKASLGWRHEKHENIDLDEIRAGRKFVWVEDELSPDEYKFLSDNNWLDNFFFTDVFRDRDALIKTTEKIKEWCTSNGI